MFRVATLYAASRLARKRLRPSFLSRLFYEEFLREPDPSGAALRTECLAPLKLLTSDATPYRPSKSLLGLIWRKGCWRTGCWPESILRIRAPRRGYVDGRYRLDRVRSIRIPQYPMCH